MVSSFFWAKLNFEAENTRNQRNHPKLAKKGPKSPRLSGFGWFRWFRVVSLRNGPFRSLFGWARGGFGWVCWFRVVPGTMQCSHIVGTIFNHLPWKLTLEISSNFFRAIVIKLSGYFLETIYKRFFFGISFWHSKKIYVVLKIFDPNVFKKSGWIFSKPQNFFS